MGVSTHVLDVGSGRPAVGVPVRLEHDGRPIAEGVTDGDGRIGALAAGSVDPGMYRIVFDTAAQGNPFYPEVAITFVIEDGAEHYHIPLLLSGHGYTTYRGS
ncbi:MAG: hydroxyisourate hydrolase [Actinobacteria bacterium]|nr:MAG: hydroxyisourate hydrolase [Actinomycetota bacterium]